MPIHAITFLLGDVFLQHFSHLPHLYWAVGFLLFLILLKIRYSFPAIILMLVFGFTYSLWYVDRQLQLQLPRELEGKTITALGTIRSIPEASEHQASFLFSLTKLDNHRSTQTIHLSWRNVPQTLRVGDEWQLSLRLKRIHGMMNPGGFDYETWALQEGIHAQGYVVNHAANKFIKHHPWRYPIDQFRQKLKEKIEMYLPVSNTSMWIEALALGERHGISQDKWEVLRSTGTNHLMAIAGLHIGFMSGFMLLIVSFLWRRSVYLMHVLPALHAGAIAALIMGFAYSALAGFLLPTQRAAIMLTTFLAYLLLRRQLRAWHAWSIALFLVLLMNPLCILTESFWLSFGSVALIIYGVSGRLNPEGIWWKWGRIQWVIALGLVPFSVCLFQQCSIVSVLANGIAIPWVGFIIVPLTLLGSVFLFISSKIGTWILILADKNLSFLWCILSYLSHLSWAVWYQFIPSLWIIIAACVGVVLLLVPAGFPGRWLGVVWLLPMILYKPLPLKFGDVQFTVLDVGQGLANVIQTQHHILVFDAGARLSDSYDMGNSVVMPFLRTLAAKQVDMLVISHGDNDHLGGANAVLQQIPVRSIYTSVPEKFTVHANYCLKNIAWNWDGVNFQFLYPIAEKLNLDNDSSCVLKISSHQKTILLTGDIEKAAEKYLIANDKALLTSDVLVAPHHGSKTSAETGFIQSVNPRDVIFSVGYRNRYHFPNPSVVEKYKQFHVRQFDTVQNGAMTYKITDDHALGLELYRQVHKHYWNNG